MGNQLVTLTQEGQAVTTSLIIAEGAGVQHKNVLELIHGYLEKLERFGRVAFETRPFETPGGTQKREVALLNERQATALLNLMRNTERVTEFKFALADAFWTLVEHRKIDPATLTRRQLAIMVIEAEDRADELAAQNAKLADKANALTHKNEHLQNKVDEYKPKVETLDAIAASDGSVLISEAAKALNVGQKYLFGLLERNKVIYKRGANWMGYNDALEKGWVEHSVSEYEHNGEARYRFQVRLTHAGVAVAGSMVYRDRPKSNLANLFD